MEILHTPRQQMRFVAERWKKQYFTDQGWRSMTIGDSEKIYEALNALDPLTATEADVEAIVGNRTWTNHFYVHCSSYQPLAADFRDDVICLDCLRRAVALLEALQ